MTGEPATDPRKFIIGWLTCRPDRRDEVAALIGPCSAAARAEPGCLFYEMNPCLMEPDVVTLAEGWASREAHEAHLATEAFRQFWDRLHDLCIEGRFENVYLGRVEPQAVDFTDRG